MSKVYLFETNKPDLLVVLMPSSAGTMSRAYVEKGFGALRFEPIESLGVRTVATLNGIAHSEGAVVRLDRMATIVV